MTLTPNFFIVGAPKSGTTSLFHYLQEHPEVFLPELKEPHFFSCPEVKATYYKTEIVDSKEKYLNLYQSEKSFKSIGDLSSSYLFNKKAAKRINTFNPDAKIIIVLRNPVERAISHYLMDVNLGYINVSLKTILKNKDEYKKFYQEYIELGFYDKQIEIYKEYFPESQIHIILTSSLHTETEDTLKSIYSFINVSTTFKPDFNTKYNQYRKPRFGFLKKILKSNILKTTIPSGMKATLKPLLFNQNAEKPKLEKEKSLLKEIYKNSILKTEELISKDLAPWK
jgi:hypothetical protein